MAVVDVRVVSSVDAAGWPVVRLGVPLLDEYLEFVAGRSRPNTVVAVAFDLKVFFEVVGKPPVEVTRADVLGFITAQRTGGDGRRLRSVAGVTAQHGDIRHAGAGAGYQAEKLGCARTESCKLAF